MRRLRLTAYLRLMDAIAYCGGFGSPLYIWTVRRASNCVDWTGDKT